MNEFKFLYVIGLLFIAGGVKSLYGEAWAALCFGGCTLLLALILGVVKSIDGSTPPKPGICAEQDMVRKHIEDELGKDS